MEDYKALIAQGRPTKFPIVLYHHIYLTETKVYKWDTVVQQTAASINTHPEYFKKQDNYTMIDKDTSMLNIAFLLYYMFKANNITSFNKRL